MIKKGVQELENDYRQPSVIWLTIFIFYGLYELDKRNLYQLNEIKKKLKQINKKQIDYEIKYFIYYLNNNAYFFIVRIEQINHKLNEVKETVIKIESRQKIIMIKTSKVYCEVEGIEKDVKTIKRDVRSL